MTTLFEDSRPVITYPADGSVAPVIRSVWYPLEIESLPDQPADQLAGKKIVIVGGEEDVAGRLAAALQSAGAQTYRYSPPAGHSQDQDQRQAIAELRQRLGLADGIIDLNVAEPYDPATGENWAAALGQSVALLKAFYQEWATTTDTNRIFYMPVTRLGGQMGFGGGPISQPFGGIWAGLAKTLPREVPNCNIKILDFSPEDYRRLDSIVLRELYRWGLFEVGYYEGKRYTLVCKMEPAGRPDFRLDEQDTVLISGGGRGIGFALAKSLARSFNSRVIVTGRSPLPSPEESWLNLDPAAFKAFTQNLYKNIPAGKKAGDVRQEVLRITAHKELYDHIRAVQQEGLRIEYRACDFNSPRKVAALLDEIGPSLSGVIHNAGVDSPVRLPSKTAGDFVNTISIKVSGFLNLFQALKERPLKFFCSVGSLTGRWGGMIGQLDYSAGNEGLARLGLWGARQVNFPLKTLCWPTWDRLGIIANFEATLKYMRAVDVTEGIYHWQRELLTGGSGEICFNGPIGQSLTPVLLRGYPPESEVPQAERLYSQLHYTGDVTEFKVFSSFRSISRVEARFMPAMYDFRAGGAPALPVSLLLEYALSTAEWVAPEGWPQLYLREIRGLKLDLAGLAAPDGSLLLEKQGQGRWEGSLWVVEVSLAKQVGDAAQELAALEVVYSREPAPPPAGPAFEFNPDGPAATLTPPANLTWTGLIFKPARWRTSAGDGLAAEVSPVLPSDLWTVPFLPALLLPAAQLENILRAGLALQKPDATRLEIERITFLAEAGRAGQGVAGRRSGDSWSVYDEAGQPLLEVAGLRGC